MDRKMNRRGARHDHVLSKTMIGSPTNFIHVGHSYLPQDRFDDCELAEEATADLKECLTEVSPEEQEEGEGEGEGEGAEEEEGQGGEEEQGSEDDALPLPPSSPSSARRNSRRISKDMISLPTNFRHLLHIDPSSADPEQLSQLLKTSNDPEYDSHNGQQHQHDHDDPTWHPLEPPKEPHPPHTAPKPARPSLRVRKSMIGPPTNFQHVDHISAGERLSAPESPPPQLPSEPTDGEGGGAGGHETIWEYHEETTALYTASTAHYTPSSNHYTPPTAHYTTESTYDRPTSPPIRVPTTYITSSTTSTRTAPYTPLRSPHSTPPTTYTSSTLPCPSSSSIHTSSTSTSYFSASTPSTTVSSRYTNTNTHYTRASSYYSTSSTPTAPRTSSPIPHITHAPAKPKPTPPPLPHYLPLPGIATASAPRSAPPHRDATRKSLPISGGGADLAFDFHQFRVPPPPRQNGGL